LHCHDFAVPLLSGLLLHRGAVSLRMYAAGGSEVSESSLFYS
jgi:hypothetical protein